MMKSPRYLITGCGRSGTSFLAATLEKAGVHCGHEEVFHINGDSAKPYRYESSWYGAPFIKSADGLTHVLHVVRQPEKVMASFYRIGLCSPTIWRHVTFGRPMHFWIRHVLKANAAKRRIDFVKGHRRFLKAHSTVLEPSDEIARLDQYWTQWNGMIERSALERGVNYMRIRLEDVDAEADKIAEFLGLGKPLPLIAPTNRKTKYAARPMPAFSLSCEARELAQRYGYDA